MSNPWLEQGDSEMAKPWFNQSAEYWKQATALTAGNCIEAQNWLEMAFRIRTLCLLITIRLIVACTN